MKHRPRDWTVILAAVFSVGCAFFCGAYVGIRAVTACVVEVNGSRVQ